MADEWLRRLRGRECASVAFVRDYVEVGFDGPVMRCLTEPYGRVGGVSWRAPGDAATVAMRRYIGLVVTGASYYEGSYLALLFGDDSWVVPLDDAARFGPEAAHLQDGAELWVL